MAKARSARYSGSSCGCGAAPASAPAQPESTDLTIAIVDVHAGHPSQGLQPIVYRIDATNTGTRTPRRPVSVVVTLATGLTFDTVTSQRAWAGVAEQAVGVMVCTLCGRWPAR